MFLAFFPSKTPDEISSETKFRLRLRRKFFRLRRPPDEISSETKSETKFRLRVFAKVMLKRAYWPERVGKACEWSVCPPGCNYLTLLPLLEGFKVAKKFLAFPPLYMLCIMTVFILHYSIIQRFYGVKPNFLLTLLVCK